METPYVVLSKKILYYYYFFLFFPIEKIIIIIVITERELFSSPHIIIIFLIVFFRLFLNFFIIFEIFWLLPRKNWSHAGNWTGGRLSRNIFKPFFEIFFTIGYVSSKLRSLKTRQSVGPTSIQNFLLLFLFQKILFERGNGVSKTFGRQCHYYFYYCRGQHRPGIFPIINIHFHFSVLALFPF